MGRPYKGLHYLKELALILESIQLVLITDIFFDDFFIHSYCAHVVSTTPEMASPVLLRKR